MKLTSLIGNALKRFVVALEYQASPRTVSDGEYSSMQGDEKGNMKTTNQTYGAGEDLVNHLTVVEQRYSYETITLAAPTTTVVKNSAGFLHALDFTATANGVITIYDNTTATGTPIRTITSPATLLQSEVNKILNIEFSTGLTIVTSGAAQDILVSYR